MIECRGELVKPGNNGILDTVEQADEIFLNDGIHILICWNAAHQNILVRTTSTANLDSRLLVTTSDLAKQKARNMELGDASFNVDEYITKLVTFMGGRHLVGDDNSNREDSMNWAALGRAAVG